MHALHNILKLSPRVSGKSVGMGMTNTSLKMLKNAHSASFLELIGSRYRHLGIAKDRARSLSYGASRNLDLEVVVVQSMNHVGCPKKDPVAFKESTRGRQYSTLQRFFNKFKFWKTNNARLGDVNKEHLCDSSSKKEIASKKVLVFKQTPNSPKDTSMKFATKKRCTTCGGYHLHNLRRYPDLDQLEANKYGKLVPERPRAQTTVDLINPPSLPWKSSMELSAPKQDKLIVEETDELPKKSLAEPLIQNNLQKPTETINKEEIDSFVILSKRQLQEDEEEDPIPLQSPTTQPVVRQERLMILKLTPQLEPDSLTQSLDDLVKPSQEPSASRPRVTILSKFPFQCDSSCSHHTHEEWLVNTSKRKFHTCPESIYSWCSGGTGA